MPSRARSTALAVLPKPLSPPAGAAQVVRIRRRRELTPLNIKRPPPGLNPVAVAEWHRLARELLDVDAVATIDANVLTAYCTVFAHWREAEEQVVELGLVVKGPTGAPQVNPYLQVADRCIAQLLTLGRELGLSPAARGELRRPAR